MRKYVLIQNNKVIQILETNDIREVVRAAFPEGAFWKDATGMKVEIGWNYSTDPSNGNIILSEVIN